MKVERIRLYTEHHADEVLSALRDSDASRAIDKLAEVQDEKRRVRKRISTPSAQTAYGILEGYEYLLKLHIKKRRVLTGLCPNRAEHTACPEGYLEWHAWAEVMMKTHTSTKCPSCNRYGIWVKRCT